MIGIVCIIHSVFQMRKMPHCVRDASECGAMDHIAFLMTKVSFNKLIKYFRISTTVKFTYTEHVIETDDEATLHGT